MTYTHLTVGTSKLPSKPPRAQPPCLEPYIVGTNILRDPGFELLPSNVGLGPNGDELPEVGGSLPWTYFDDSLCPVLNPEWATDYTDYNTPRRWFVSTADPRAGTYHARMEGKTSIRDGLSTNYGDRLFAMMFVWCDNPSVDWQWGGRVSEGDYIRFGCWAKASTVTGAPYIQPAIYIANHAGDAYVASSRPNLALTTSYAWYETSLFAPVNAYYLETHVSVLADTYASIPTNITVDVDDAVLEVS